MQLVLKKPPTFEPVSLEETRAYLRLSSEIEDPLVSMLISASRAYIEKITGRALLKQGWELHLTPPYPPFSPLVQTKKGEINLILPLPPLLEIISLTSKDRPVLYLQEGTKLRISASFYEEPLTIAFWAGYGETPSSLPPDLKAAVLLGTRFLYDGQKIDIPFLTAYKVFRLH